MLRQPILTLLLGSVAILAQKYGGPRPPKSDVPYLMHADNLLETESTEAKEVTHKDEVAYYIPGANSPVKTPLASPIFLLKAEKLAADKLELYRLEPRNGQREVLVLRKKKPVARPFRLSTTRLSEDNLYKIEVDESLPNGQYSLSPSGSNQAFCFQVY